MSVPYTKENYERLKAHAKAIGIKTATRNVSDSDWADFGYNGLSIAYVPGNERGNSRMIAVAVSYCALEDTFSKKIGKFNALVKLCVDGQFVQMPLGEYCRETKDAGEVADTLLNVFNV